MKYFLIALIVISYCLRTNCVYQLVWSDEFDGTSLNTAVWNIDSGDQWYNNELQAYTPSNVIVENGYLRLEGRRQSYLSKSYTSGRINSEGKKSFTFGRFEARMKLPTGKGFWPGFWLWPESYNTNSYKEIDIMEAIGDLPKTIFSTCWGGPESKLVQASKEFNLPSNYDQDYHVYYAEWKAGQISFGVDSTTFFTCSSSNMGAGYAFDTAKFHIILNLAVGGDWPGTPSSTTVFPSSVYVDYVRVYQDDGSTSSTSTNTSNSTSTGSSTGTTVPIVTGATSCSSYTTTYLKGGIQYWVGVGKVNTALIKTASVSRASGCCNLCGTTNKCIALKYSSGTCSLLSQA